MRELGTLRQKFFSPHYETLNATGTVDIISTLDIHHPSSQPIICVYLVFDMA
jgi:hypothetical protein